VNLDGTIRRRHRKSFEQFLRHENPRIRAVAEEMLKEDTAERASRRARYESEEALFEAWLSSVEFQDDGEGAAGVDDSPGGDELPF
jgi:hypothetical protein